MAVKGKKREVEREERERGEDRTIKAQRNGGKRKEKIGERKKERKREREYIYLINLLLF